MRQLENTQFSSSRLARVIPSIASCAVGWISFGVYYLLTARPTSGVHCIFQGCLGFFCASRARSNPHQRASIAKFYVMDIIVGLTIEACLSGIATSISPMFYTCAVLVATLTLGTRFAIKTIVISLLLVLAINFVFPFVLPASPGPQPLDRMLSYITLLGVLASCALIGESTTDKFARRLEKATLELRERTESLDQIVGIDSLTSLPNRRRLQQDAANMLKTDSQHRGFALLLIDLNEFKLINDRHGHAEGDRVLQDFSSQLSGALDDASELYRVGGDEFVVIATGELTELRRLVHQTGETVLSITDSVARRAKSAASRLGGSVGAALYPEHADSLDDLISFADKAMYEAKASKRLSVDHSVVIFESRMAEQAEQRRQLEDALTEAIKNEEFVLFYQPQVEIATNRIVGAEALIRWQKDGEFISPFSFIPALEESGKIVEVGTWVLHAACKQMAQWRSNGFDIHVSVNVSSLQLQQPAFADVVLDILKENDLPAKSLDIEVTESLLLETCKHVHQNIERLANEDIQFSIDDFGTGYSSLSYLKRLIVHRLKIDRSFIKDIPDTDDGAIAATVIGLAKQLGLTVVGEGVETPAQLQFLRDRGCEEFQGYLFSKPVPAQDCTKLLEDQFRTEDQSQKQIPSAQSGILVDTLTWQSDVHSGNVT